MPSHMTVTVCGPCRHGAHLGECLVCREEYEERAAIREYDGGLTREDAEREARADVLKMRRTDGVPRD